MKMDNSENKKNTLEDGQIIESPVIRDRETDVEDSNRSSGEGTPIYLTPNSTLQSPEEHAHDESVDPRLDDTMEVSNDDLGGSGSEEETTKDTNE
jgi:hypothetical protein